MVRSGIGVGDSRVYGLRVQEFRVQGLRGFRASGLRGFGAAQQGSGFWLFGLGIRIYGCSVQFQMCL